MSRWSLVLHGGTMASLSVIIIESKVGIDRILKKSRQDLRKPAPSVCGMGSHPLIGASVTPPSAASSALSSPRQWCLCPAGWGNGCSETGQGLE